MVFNAIGRIIGYFFFIVALAFLLTNTVLFIGYLVYDEIGKYRTTGELTTMSITELNWMEILQFHPKYIFVYIVVGIFVLIRYTLWSFNEFRTAVRESKDKARKSKELEIARKHNHKQRLLEYRQEEQELEKIEQNLDQQTADNLDGKKLLETVENAEQVEDVSTNIPIEDEKPITDTSKPQKKVKVVTARKRSTVDKDLNPNQESKPKAETKVERMIREKKERERKEEMLRKQAQKRNLERERKQQEMNQKYQSEEEDDKDFKIKGVFNRKD